MPYISIRVACDDKRDELNRLLAEGSTQIMAEVLGKRAELTAVSVERLAPAQWSIAGESVAERGQSSAFVSAKISVGSNTADQVEQAITAFYQLLHSVLGTLSEVSYVVIDEVPMTHWGCGGRTQLWRQQARFKVRARITQPAVCWPAEPVTGVCNNSSPAATGYRHC